MFFVFPLKMSPTLIWHFKRSTKPSLRSDVEKSTDGQMDRSIDKQDDYCSPLAHAG